MQDRTNRAASKRFARNLALSLAGGAALTVIGAAAAQADEAGTSSDGASGTGTGDATAVGNKSGTQTGQTLAPSGGSGSPQVITQTAVVPNVGVAVANTGGNVAVGNTSNNIADTTQNSSGGTIADANTGDASNASDGSAWISTGNASAIGNESSTSINQVHTNAGVGGLLVVDQDALVVNAGLGVANTGLNASVGNGSTNTAGLLQTATGAAGGLATNTGTAATGSNGRSSVNTGDASAAGNSSRTEVAQGGGPGDGESNGLLIIDQNALVANAGLGLANTGGNVAAGNISDNTAGDPGDPLEQEATNSLGGGSLVGLSIASNTADVSTNSDGDASITTGDADATGNMSNTNVTQAAHGTPDSLGGIVSTQNAGVLNVGIGAANTGLNAAVGNATQDNEVDLNGIQTATNDGDFITGVLTASNSLNASASSDGSAEIATGDASATGNHSDTNVDQAYTGTVNAGIGVNTQTAGVLNAGAGIANTGGNLAIGNASSSLSTLDAQAAEIDADVTAPVITTSNSADVSTASDGSASIHTGDASAIGNTSGTNLTQSADDAVDGMGTTINAQTAGVANVGLGVANSGLNAAAGNISTSESASTQDALILGDLTAAGPVTAANTASVATASDGEASVYTGDSWARGNYSETTLDQAATGTIPDGAMGVVPNVQTAGVLNAGVGLANSGVNGAVGNASGQVFGPNSATVDQDADIDATGLVLGPVTLTNQADVSNASDGTAKVGTGDAEASGNWSQTVVGQNLDTTVDGGTAIAPQTAAVVNLGAGVANSGINAAVGNLSSSQAAVGAFLGPQTATYTGGPDVVAGPLTVGNTAAVSNASDGEACVCTGDATASGNIARSALSQDVEIGVEDGVSVAPTTGLIFNAGFGLANSGVNLAIGNISQNTANTDQSATFVDPGLPIVPAQTITNNGGASNASNGLGEVGTGNATAVGNDSVSDLAQAAVIDGAGVIAPITGTIGNAGAGIANAGVNLGVGNASVNDAYLDQTASGSGVVSNSGSADNESDGTAQIGDPDCEDKDEATTPEGPEAPGGPSLPKTGTELQAEAALALMLLLAGFGLRKGAKHLA